MVKKVAVFDLDGTLTWHDTFVPFLGGFARRHPGSLLGVWRLPLALWVFALRRDRGTLKAAFIRALMRGRTRPMLERWADAYVGSLQARGMFRPAALAQLNLHRSAGDHLVLLSASPDLYVPRIGRLLGFDRTVCTEVRWRRVVGEVDTLEGTLTSANRRGEEKSRCLAAIRAEFPDLRVIAYGNSASDLPHLAAADESLLVNATAAARRMAVARGIPTADWR